MGGGTRVTTQSSKPWDIQIPYLKKGFAGAEELLKAGAPAYYQGSTVAGFDPAQQAAQKAILGYAMGPRAARQQMGAENQLAGTYGLANQLGGAGMQAGAYGAGLAQPLSQSQFGGLTPFSGDQYANMMAGNVDLGPTSPYAATANALQQQVMGRLKGDILPGLRNQMMTSGQQGGSSRNELVQNKAIANAVQQGMTKPLADMYSGAYQQAQGMRLPAAQMGLDAQQYGMGYGLQGLGAAQGGGQLGLGATSQYPGVMNAPLGMYGAMADVGDQRRALSQAGIDADVARYNYESMSPYQALANYMGSISGDYGGQSTMTQPGPSALSSLGQIAGIASMFSDERLKENITQIGSFNGLGVYEFNYLWSPTKMIGFIAQEVEKVLPEAVKEILGYKAVDYGKVLGEV